MGNFFNRNHRPIKESGEISSYRTTQLTPQTIIRKWRIWTTTLLATTIALFFAGMEVFLTLIIRGPYSRGISWPVTFVGVLAAVLLIIGYLPVPFELWKRRGRVVGIDFGFLTIDWFGAFFSLMALGEFWCLCFACVGLMCFFQLRRLRLISLVGSCMRLGEFLDSEKL